MKRLNNKLKVAAFIMILGFLLFSNPIQLEAFDSPTITLKLIVNGPTEYSLYIRDYLDDINIEVDIRSLDWFSFMEAILDTQNYDLALICVSNGGETPDMRAFFTEEGPLNLFRLERSIPYQNQSEEMQELSVTITNLNERQSLLYNWQKLVMDRILPCLPLPVANKYVATWDTTKGYNYSWGLVNSLPYMYNDGFHEGQISIDEWNQCGWNWNELNPVLSESSSSRDIWELCSEPIVMWNPLQIPSKTGLVYDWEHVEDNHFKFYVRDNIFWNPSLNITERNEFSAPLVTESSPDVWEITDPSILTSGLKDSVVSNGTNVQVTAKDCVFTFLAMSNPLISEDSTRYDFIRDLYVDPMDNLTFHLFVDGDADTPEIELYVDFFHLLSDGCLPEFYLNSTSPEISYSSGGVKTWGLYNGIQDTPQWRTFSNSCFGHGKYMLDYYIQNSLTVHSRSPFWSGIGAIDGQIGMDLFFEKILTHVILDSSFALDLFKLGQLDIMEMNIFPDDRRLMESNGKYTVYSKIYDHFPILAFNLQREYIGGEGNNVFLNETGKEQYTQALALRKAICHAIDRDEMNTEILKGEYNIAHSCLYLKTEFYYYEDVIKYDHNLTKAMDWFDSATTTDPTETPTETNYPFILIFVLPLFPSYLIIRIKKRKLG